MGNFVEFDAHNGQNKLANRIPDEKSTYEVLPDVGCKNEGQEYYQKIESFD